MGQLVKKNIKLRYRRSYLGMLWTLIEPLLTMIVLSVVFGSLLGRNSTDAAFAGVPFPIYVLTGRLLYSFFSSATNSAMRSIRTNGAMIKKISTFARQDMENFFDCKVYLQTWIKVKEDWRNSVQLMRNFGFDENDFK